MSLLFADFLTARLLTARLLTANSLPTHCSLFLIRSQSHICWCFPTFSACRRLRFFCFIYLSPVFICQHKCLFPIDLTNNSICILSVRINWNLRRTKSIAIHRWSPKWNFRWLCCVNPIRIRPSVDSRSAKGTTAISLGIVFQWNSPRANVYGG
jgi:hypothetical protein